MSASVKDWVIASRPWTLIASVIPVLLAHAWLISVGRNNDASRSCLALLSAICIQIGTNFYNDYIDFQRGADNERRIGPKRLIQSGKASSRAVARAAHVSFIFATLLGIPLVQVGGTPILLLGIFSILCGYGYTAPPLSLAYRGLSEVFVILFFGVFAVTGVVWLHTQQVYSEAVYLGLAVGCLSCLLLVANNLRDWQQDRLVGKMTLVAQYGSVFGVREYWTLYTLAFLFCIFVCKSCWIIFIPIALFFGLELRKELAKPENPKLLILSAKIFLAFATALFFTFLIPW